MRPTVQRWIRAAAALVLVGATFYHCVLPFVPITTPLAYGWLRGRWRPEAIAHFPERPGVLGETRGFYYFPGPMQASTEMELRIAFEPDAFARERARLDALPASEDADRHGSSYPRPVFQSAPGQAFEIRILHSRPTFYGEDPSWNHGRGRGYAWNADTHEIVYWCEVW